MWIKLLLASLIVVASTSLVNAKENCDDPQTQTDMNICSGLSYKKSDEQLNKTYQKAISILRKYADAEKEENFRKIQRAWIKYRDLHCNYASSLYEGGSIRPLIHASCMEKLTKERTNNIPDLFAEWSTN